MVRRLPSPGSVIAAVAILLVGGGGVAVAVNTVGSRDVIDGSLRSVDIQDGDAGVRSVDIADGTVNIVDVSQNARDSLRGQTGPRGPAGPAGPAGP